MASMNEESLEHHRPGIVPRICNSYFHGQKIARIAKPLEENKYVPAPVGRWPTNEAE